jgi:hypothetical protein
VVELLRILHLSLTPQTQARASALRALDEGIMRALSPEAVAAARQAAQGGRANAAAYRLAARGGRAALPYTPVQPIASPYHSASASISGRMSNGIADAAAAAAAAEGVHEDIQNMLLVCDAVAILQLILYKTARQLAPGVCAAMTCRLW